MKRTMLIVSLTVLGAALGFGGISYAHGTWGGGYGSGGWGCPMMGENYGSGPGMMGQGYGPQYQQPQNPITKSDAETMLKNYVSRNPNLKLGAVKEEGDSFEADMMTKDGALVNKLYVDKDTGWMHSQY